ncbi:hypothetical protein [Pandoraea sputorum]|uniref:Uncharacterized protein n=1 Tax=Pandoraea sputorum TaxID=93222 RepID=A0A5E5BB12_9BURK|nr:hypothetical protein [Pandoraea sputorum]VVE82874.1 hypothetical protein PSP31121_04011 [Pandoraea sputorum]
MKPYLVRAEIYAVVMAEDESDAVDMSFLDVSDILADMPVTMEWQSMGEVKSAEGLPQGWDGMCLPYGRNEAQLRLGEILEGKDHD